MSLPDDAPCPRLCHLIKWPDFDGYGFNLHAEKTKTGQYIGKVDEDSPALLAGLREGDKIIEVNNVNICNENHRQVVERIKSMPNETKLLVADEEMEKWYRDRELVIKSSQANVIHYRTPVPRPQGTGLLPIPLSTASLMTNGKSGDQEGKSENGSLVRQESVSASLKSGSISEVSQASSDLASAAHSNHTNHQQQVQVDVEPCVTPTKNGGGGGGGDLSRATSSVSGTASVEDLGASGQSSWSPSSPHPLASASVAAAVSSSTTTSSSLNHTDHHHSSYHSSSPSTTPSSSNDGHGRGSPTNSQSSATLPPASPPHSNNTGASGQLFQSNSIISSNGSEGKNSLHSSSNGGSVERINGNGTSQVNGNHSSLSASPSAEGGGSVDSLSGDFLNLNMTASQMRALLAQRKKKNIKEDNIDIMEKFRKLQQL